MNEAQKSYMRECIQHAVESVLDRYEVVPLASRPTQEGSGSDDSVFVSMVGFKGDKAAGSILLGCDRQFLIASCPGLKPDEPKPVPFILDWVGEIGYSIANVLTEILSHEGLDLTLNPPSVSEASLSIFDTYASRMPSEILWFQVENYRFCLLVCANFDDPKVLQKPLNQTNGTGQSHLTLVSDATSEPRRVVDENRDLAAAFAASVAAHDQPQEAKPIREISEKDEPGQSILSKMETSSLLSEEIPRGLSEMDEPTPSLDLEVGSPSLATEEIPRELSEKHESEQSLESEVGSLSFTTVDSRSSIANLKKREELTMEEPKSSESNEENRVTGIRSRKTSELTIEFASGIEYTLPIKKLVEAGTGSIVIENTEIELMANDDGVMTSVSGVRVFLPLRKSA